MESIWSSASKNSCLKKKKKNKQSTEHFSADSLMSRQREEMLNIATQPWEQVTREHLPVNLTLSHTHTPHTGTSFSHSCPSTPEHQSCTPPSHPHHLEIRLAIQARCSDVTGPINTTWGQKYQVTGEGLICFHFYYVSNLEEKKRFNKKPSKLFLDTHRFSFSQSLEEITLAKRDIREFKIMTGVAMTPTTQLVPPGLPSEHPSSLLGSPDAHGVGMCPSTGPQLSRSIPPSTNADCPCSEVIIYFPAESWWSQRLCTNLKCWVINLCQS